MSRPAHQNAGLFASAGNRDAILCLLLAVLTLAVYNPVSRHPFVNYDDDRYVTGNAHVRDGLTWNTFAWALTATEEANWHPLTWMSHALDVSLFRLNPAGHHFTSVLLHVANVMLLFLLLARGTNRWGAGLAVAAWFAVHPLMVESVAWVAERKNILCTLFFLLTLGAYGWYARHPTWKRYLVVLLLFAAGLASKPMVITLPFVLLLLDYWPLGRVRVGVVPPDTSLPSPPLSRLALEKVPLLALSAISAVTTIHAQQAGGAVRSIAQFSFGVRVENAIYAYAMYLWKTVWPAKLAPLYPHPGDSLAAWQLLSGAALLVGITAVVFIFRERRYLVVGWLWFLGTLIPVIGLVQVGDAAMADRYAYIPLIGIFVMIAFGFSDLARRRQVAIAWQAAAVGLVTAAFCVMTYRQIGYWNSNYDLWTHTLAVTADNFIAEDNLGGALVLEGKEEEAFPHFERAARINSRDAMSRSNLGTYFQTHGRMREAVGQYESAIALTSDRSLLAQTYANLGAAQRALGENADAHSSFAESLRLNPGQFNAWLGLGLLAQSDGKTDESVSDLSRSLDLQPTAEAYFELGRTLAQGNRPVEARAAYEQALKVQPDFAAAQKALAGLGR